MKGLCTYCGERPISAKGLCHNCYVRYKRNGTPKPLGTRRAGHPKADIKIKAWKEHGKSYTKAAEVLGCSRQAIYDAVNRHYKGTNADRIRKMTDEELAEFMCHNVSNGTVNCAFCSAEEFCRMGHNGWFEWLQKECE